MGSDCTRRRCHRRILQPYPAQSQERCTNRGLATVSNPASSGRVQGRGWRVGTHQTTTTLFPTAGLQSGPPTLQQLHTKTITKQQVGRCVVNEKHERSIGGDRGGRSSTTASASTTADAASVLAWCSNGLLATVVGLSAVLEDARDKRMRRLTAKSSGASACGDTIGLMVAS